MNINYDELLDKINFYNPSIGIPVFFNYNNNNNISSYIDSIVLHNSILFEKYINIKYNLEINQNNNNNLINKINILENNNKNLLNKIIILENDNNNLINFNKKLINNLNY